MAQKAGHTAEQLLELVRSEATAFGRCCDQYQDGLGTFCCHECGQRTMAMLAGVHSVLGLNGKSGEPIPLTEAAEARKMALVRRAAPDLLEALITALPHIESAETDEHYKPGAVAKVTAQIRAALTKAGAL
jgi:hypothetical protein